jgi:hypothetical protein
MQGCFMSAFHLRVDIKRFYPRPPYLPYSPPHLFPTGTDLQAVCCSGKGAVPAKEFLFVLSPVGYLRTMGANRTNKMSVTSSSFPGVPSRTRGYYGPRARVQVGRYELRYRLSPI